MRIDENVYLLIDAYLKGTLNKEERVDFESKLKNDLELQEEFKRQKNLFETINEQDWSQETNINIEDAKALGDYFNSESAKKTKEAINLAQQEYKASTSKVIKLKYFYPIAAALLLLFGYFTLFGGSSSERLYNNYNDWSSLPSLTERFDDATNLSKAEQFFKNKNYQDAVVIFKSHSDNVKNPQVLTYLGVSYLELEDYESAIKTFDDLLETNSLDKTKAYWYKALIYLKQDRKKDVLKMLDIILEKESNYNYTQAKELRGQI